MVRRPLLAAPFVVTVAAACHRGAEAPVSHNPPELAPPVTPRATSTAAPSAPSTVVPVLPAAPSAAPVLPPSSSPQTWLIKEKDAKCTSEILPDCSQFPCTSSTPKPYPCPPAPEFPATVRRWSGQVVCIVQTTPTMHCPPTATCNPPAAEYARVPCPE